MNIAYFKDGELYDVSPRSNLNDLFENREVAYKADIIISDGKEYDLSSADDIRAIPVPAFNPDIPAVLELSYILKVRCGAEEDASLIPAFVQKTLELMNASCFIWQERDYLQVIRNYYRVGLIEDGKKYKAEFLEQYGNINQSVIHRAQEAALVMGDQLGYDAVQITAHGLCSIDHEPIQGQVFLRKEYEKMQSGKPFRDVDGRKYAPLVRPIGVNGCKHFANSFSTKYSKRIYSKKMIAELYKENHRTFIVDGKKYPRYEIYAFMQEIAAEIRGEKEIAVDAIDRNDMETRIRCQRCINTLSKRYHELAQIIGVKPPLRDIQVVGFRAVRKM